MERAADTDHLMGTEIERELVVLNANHDLKDPVTVAETDMRDPEVAVEIVLQSLV
jgi:hypothetical protein